MIEFTIPIEPVPWSAPKVVYRASVGHAMAITKDKVKEYQHTVRLHAQDAMGTLEPFVGPVRIEVHFWFKLPKSRGSSSKDRTRWKKAQMKLTRPDLSNLIKSVEDSLSGVVYVDDNQVVGIHATKWYEAQGKPGYVLVGVYEL